MLKLFVFSDVNNLDNYRTIQQGSASENATLPNASKTNVVRSPPRKRKQSSPIDDDSRNVKKPRKSQELIIHSSKSKSDVTACVGKTRPEATQISDVKSHSKSQLKSPQETDLDLDINREIVPQIASISKAPTTAKSVDKNSQKNKRQIEETG